jgi:hypothetical protein
LSSEQKTLVSNSLLVSLPNPQSPVPNPQSPLTQT